MNVTIEVITPDIAQQYLSKNTTNRQLRQKVVSQYARDMRLGSWQLTHQGIAFNCDGTLLDGQHRLAAIIESGASIPMLVARGIASQSQLVMDDHLKRTTGDSLSLVRKELITNTDVAVVRIITEAGQESSKKKKPRPTRQEIGSLIDTFREPMTFISRYITSTEKGVTTAPVKASIVLAWFYVDDLQRLATFCEVLSGKRLADGVADVAATKLREWLIKFGAHSGSQRTEAFRKTQRAIVAFVDRKGLQKIHNNGVYYAWPLKDTVRS